MTTLTEKSRENLKIIKNLGHEEILSSSSLRELSVQEEFVEVDNLNELENGIYFTFHQCLSDIPQLDFLEKDILIKDIDESIQNIYDNKKLNTLMENKSELYKIMDDIDIKHDLLKESYYFNSPFYSYYSRFCVLKDYINDIMQNPPCGGLVKFLREYRKYHDRLNGIYYSSDEDFEDEDDKEETAIITGCDNKEE